MLPRPSPRSYPTHDAPPAEIQILNNQPTAPPSNVGIATSPAIGGGIASNGFEIFVPANNRLPRPPTHLALPPRVFPLSVVLPLLISNPPTRPDNTMAPLPPLHFRRLVLLPRPLTSTWATSYGTGSRALSLTRSPFPLSLTSTTIWTTTSPTPPSLSRRLHLRLGPCCLQPQLRSNLLSLTLP